MSGTFTNWPLIVDRALALERLPPLGELEPLGGAFRVSRATADEIWAKVDELPLTRPFGITMARVVDYADFEELGFGLAGTATVEGIAELLERYHPLLSDAITVSSRTADGSVSVVIATHGSAHWRVHEFGAALCARLARGRFGPGVNPLRVQLAVPQRHSPADYARFFRCSVELGAPVTEVAFPDALRSPGGMPRHISAGLDALLGDAITRLASTPGDRARAELYRLLAEGEASIADVAARLHISERTLQRQLADEHTSFSAIREQVVSALALRWIREGTQAISEIAYRLGYHSPSTFARAFRRWHGQSPTEARRRESR